MRVPGLSVLPVRPVAALAALAALATLTLAAAAQAADVQSFDTLAAWQGAAGGAVTTQDFQGYDSGAWLGGVSFLPGVSATSSLAELRVFDSASFGKILFAIGDRDSGAAQYDVAFSQPYRSVALDIVALEADPADPTTAAGPGLLTVWFADASTRSFEIAGNPSGAPIFFGLVANQAITGLRWTEPLQGVGGSEETALDNVRVAAVPEPASAVLGLLGLGVLALRLRRR